MYWRRDIALHEVNSLVVITFLCEWVNKTQATPTTTYTVGVVVFCVVFAFHKSQVDVELLLHLHLYWRPRAGLNALTSCIKKVQGPVSNFSGWRYEGHPAMEHPANPRGENAQW